jgi:hypothetical protein
MTDREFEELLSACGEIARAFPAGVVFIGGIAVYLHAKNHPQTAPLADTTHDADFYISLADMGDLRDLEEVTPNRRRSKHLLVKRGFEFDIYTERQSALIVPYDAVVAASVIYGDIRVASLEHLFALKLEAFLDRKDSRKGDKDAADLLRIAAVAERAPSLFRIDLCAPYVRAAHLPLLDRVERGPYATAMAKGNAVAAKKLRAAFAALSTELKAALGGNASRRARPGSKPSGNGRR